MNVRARARLRAAHVAARYNPRLEVRDISAGRVAWKKIGDAPTTDQIATLCDVFQVPEWYWTADDRASIEAGAALPFDGLEPVADLDSADLVALAFIERHQKRDPDATLRALVERVEGAQGEGKNTYKRFMQAAYDGMRSMKTMERASRVLGVPVGYWMIRNLDAARAVAAGTKAIGVVDAA